MRETIKRLESCEYSDTKRCFNIKLDYLAITVKSDQGRMNYMFRQNLGHFQSNDTFLIKWLLCIV